MVVLVTGARGFVGDALCRRLAASGRTVRGTSRTARPASEDPPAPRRRRGACGSAAPCTLVNVGNIGRTTDWADALHGVDRIVHLAARVHVMRDRTRDPLAAFREVNTAGTERLARVAAAMGVRRLVYVSSVKVHGEQTRGTPFREEDLANPGDAYALSKWEAEQALQRTASETGLEVVIVRPPLVYGPCVGGNFLRLVQWVARGVPLPLAAVDNRRSLLYVDNLVEALILCLDHPIAAGKSYLVSDAEAVSSLGLVQQLAQALGRRPRVLTLPVTLLRWAGRVAGRSADVDRLVGELLVDASKIRADLGWRPPYSLARGLLETAVWYQRERTPGPWRA